MQKVFKNNILFFLFNLFITFIASFFVLFGGGMSFNLENELWAREVSYQTRISDLNSSYHLTYGDNLEESIESYENYVKQHLVLQYNSCHQTNSRAFIGFSNNGDNNIAFQYDDNSYDIDTCIFSFLYDRLEPCKDSYLGLIPIDGTDFYQLYPNVNSILISETLAREFSNDIKRLIAENIIITINGTSNIVQIAGIYKENFYSKKLNNYFGNFIVPNNYFLMKNFNRGYIATELTSSVKMNLEIKKTGGLFDNFDNHDFLISTDGKVQSLEKEFANWLNSNNLNLPVGIPILAFGILSFIFELLLLLKKIKTDSINNRRNRLIFSFLGITAGISFVYLLNYVISPILIINYFFGGYILMGLVIALLSLTLLLFLLNRKTEIHTNE